MQKVILLLLITLVAGLFARIAQVQESTLVEIAGRVTDQEMEGPLPGVGVYVKGAVTGTSTNNDRDFLRLNWGLDSSAGVFGAKFSIHCGPATHRRANPYVSPKLGIMRGKHFFIFITLLALNSNWEVKGQPARTTNRESQVWVGYANQTWLTPRVGTWLDVGLRWTGPGNEWNTYLIRPGFSYRLSEDATATAGYALFGQRVPNPDQRIVRLEHRPWQQINWVRNAGRVQIGQRYRAEQRFIHRTQNGELVKGYRFNHRLRYQLSAAVSLRDSTRKNLVLTLADEILVNAGKQITYNSFDQNRIFAGLGYQLTN